MGVDSVGWRGCDLQGRDQDVRGFIGRLKHRAWKAEVDARVPTEDRPGHQLLLQIGGVIEELSYEVLVRAEADVAAHAEACARCPLSGGRPAGCFQHVAYPVDELFEELMFRWFLSGVIRDGTAARAVYEVLIADTPLGPDDPWLRWRGADGQGIARRAEPLVQTFENGATITSADVLSASFFSADNPTSLAVLATYWGGFVRWLDALLATPRPTAHLDPDSAELRVVVGTAADPLSAEQALDTLSRPWERENLGPDLAGRVASSTTLGEVRALAAMLERVARHAEDGWRVHMDG